MFILSHYLISNRKTIDINFISSVFSPLFIHPFNGTFSGTTHVSRYQKGKTNLDFTEAQDSEWQWHQLGHMQVCTSLQTDNHASTLALRPDALPADQPTASKHWRHFSPLFTAIKIKPPFFDHFNSLCLCLCLPSVLWRCWLGGRKGWLEYSLTPHSTQYRSFRRQSSQPITWLILTNKTVQENTDKQTQYKSEKVNNLEYSKTKLTWFSCRLQHSARKLEALMTVTRGFTCS